MGWSNQSTLSDMLGKVFTSVTSDGDAVRFVGEEGKGFSLHHDQDCCESVYVESVVGDLSDLEGEPLLMAEEATSPERDGDAALEKYEESFTWTFYKFATRKGYVDIRFFGSSNGYYGESASVHTI